MKRAFILPLAAAFLLASLSSYAQVIPAKNEETKAKVKTKNVKMKVKGNLNAVPLPYPIQYSSQFMPGDPAYSRLVLDMWKDYDNNTLDRNPGAFADTVVMYFADGASLKGVQEVMEAGKASRASLASVQQTVDAVMSVHSIDKNEDWVLVWGAAKETDKSGNAKTVPLHELWRINKDGRVDLVLQYTHAEPKK